MAVFIRTDKNPEGGILRVERGFRGADGRTLLLLHRLPPEYAKPPDFVVELSSDRVEVRGQAEGASEFFKAYAYQCFTPKETKYLSGTKPGGAVVPFLNFSYPNVLKVFGKTFECLSEAKTAELAGCCAWKLIGGQR